MDVRVLWRWFDLHRLGFCRWIRCIKGNPEDRQQNERARNPKTTGAFVENVDSLEDIKAGYLAQHRRSGLLRQYGVSLWHLRH